MWALFFRRQVFLNGALCAIMFCFLLLCTGVSRAWTMIMRSVYLPKWVLRITLIGIHKTFLVGNKVVWRSPVLL